MPTKAINFQLNGYSIAAIAYGEPSNPILLCLHGWLDNAASFSPLMPYLEDFYVIAIDWPGHGLSDHRSADAHYHFLDYIYDLLQLWQVNQWKKIAVVGHSMGGMIATAFAAAFPEKVSSLTLIDALGFIACDEQETTKQLRKGLLSRLKMKNKALSVHMNIEAAIAARVQVSDLSFELAKLIVERGIKPIDGGVVWRSDSRVKTTSPYRLSPKQADQIFHDLAIPTQLIYGDQGMSFVSAALTRYQSSKSSLDSHSLAGGHHVHMEQPEQCAALIKSFFHKK